MKPAKQDRRRRADGWKSDAPTPEERARHRAWCALNYLCDYKEYLAAKLPQGVKSSPLIDRAGAEKLDAIQSARWRELAQKRAREGLRATVPEFLESARGKGFHDRGLAGHPKAIIYKINAKALGIA